MKIVKQNVHLTPSQAEEIALKVELCEILERLQKQPSTLGLQILKRLLPQERGLLESRLEYSDKGHYFWLGLHSSSFGEAVLCLWPPKSPQKEANSLKHDHFSCQALVLPLYGGLVHTLYHVSSDKFFVYRRDFAKPLKLLFVPGWQSHSVNNNQLDEWAFSLHLYWFRRPAISLEVAED